MIGFFLAISWKNSVFSLIQQRIPSIRKNISKILPKMFWSKFKILNEHWTPSILSNIKVKSLISGPGVNSGDSGAGLTFSHDNAFHYLTGVASVKNPKESESIAVFTNVAHHISWIRTLLSLYSYSSNNKTGWTTRCTTDEHDHNNTNNYYPQCVHFLASLGSNETSSIFLITLIRCSKTWIFYLRLIAVLIVT